MQRFPFRLTEAQRRLIAALAPHLTARLDLEHGNQRTPRLTLQELREIAQACRAVVPQTLSGMERNSLRHVIDAVADVALVTTTALHIFNNEKGAKPAHPIGLGTELNLTLY